MSFRRSRRPLRAGARYGPTRIPFAATPLRPMQPLRGVCKNDFPSGWSLPEEPPVTGLPYRN